MSARNTNQYEARVAARRAAGTQTLVDAPVVGVTFRAARTNPPPPMGNDLRAKASELRAEAQRMLARAEELELAANKG